MARARAELGVAQLRRSGHTAVHTPEERAEFQAGMAADLRRTASRYPADLALQTLIADLTARSPLFAQLWTSEVVDPDQNPSKRKVIDHPAVGMIAVDCDVLFVATDDVRIMAYTPEPGTQDADRLAIAIVLGTQELVD